MAMVSLPPEQFQNMNISAYRVLFILLMLVKYRSLNLVELNRLLSENPLIGRGYNSDTLTKYINTLREVGCRIPRSTNRNDYCYELLRNPFPLALDDAEIEVVRKLLDLLAKQPDEALYRNYRQFLEDLAWSLGGQELTVEEDGVALFISPLQEVDRWRQRFNEYRRYCQEAFTLEITYLEAGEEQVLFIEPHELLEQNNQLILLGLDRNSHEQRRLDVQSVLSVRQLPSKNRRPPAQTTVVFALYGRLAKSYRLYPDEKVVYRSEQEIQIKTRLTETSGLMKRLLKYGASCQLLSPDSLREAMRQHITLMLDTLLEA